MLTNPGSVSLPFLIVPFLVFGVFTYELTYLLLVRVTRRTTLVFRRVIPGSVAFFVVVVLLLESLDQLGLKDGLILFVLTIVFWLYLWRADFLNK